jgi:hypothetical protein
VTNILPPTGVILPIISYGGNATLITLIAMGVMLNISWETARIHAAGVAVEPEEDESGGTLGVAADARPQLRPTAPTLWNETRDTERNFYGENHYGGRGYRRSSVSSPRYRG